MWGKASVRLGNSGQSLEEQSWGWAFPLCLHLMVSQNEKQFPPGGAEPVGLDQAQEHPRRGCSTCGGAGLGSRGDRLPEGRGVSRCHPAAVCSRAWVQASPGFRCFRFPPLRREFRSEFQVGMSQKSQSKMQTKLLPVAGFPLVPARGSILGGDSPAPGAVSRGDTAPAPHAFLGKAKRHEAKGMEMFWQQDLCSWPLPSESCPGSFELGSIDG